MAQNVEAIEHKATRQRPVGGELERMIRRSLVRYEKNVLAQNTWIIGATSINAGLRGAGSRRIRSIVIVDHDGQIMRQRPHIGNCGANLTRQLTLNGGIDLVDQGPLRVGGNRLDAGRWQEPGMRWTIRVGERIPIGERSWIPVDVGKRRNGVERLTNGERLSVGRLVPFVAAYAAVKHPRGCAYRRLAVTKRIPGHADTRRNVVPTQVDDTTGYSLVSRIKKAQRRAGNNRGLNIGHEGAGQVRRLDRRNVDIPTQSQVCRNPGSNPVIVLHVQRGTPVAQKP